MTLHKAWFSAFLHARNERNALTVRRAAGLKLLLEEPLTKPLGSMCSFVPGDDVTLVQWRRAEPHGVPFLVETPTEMGRIRAAAHARLAALETAAGGCARAGQASCDDARDFRAARVALRRAYASYRLSAPRPAATGDAERYAVGHVQRQRARAAWLWAVVLATGTMFLAYVLTLLVLSVGP